MIIFVDHVSSHENTHWHVPIWDGDINMGTNSCAICGKFILVTFALRKY